MRVLRHMLLTASAPASVSPDLVASEVVGIHSWPRRVEVFVTTDDDLECFSPYYRASGTRSSFRASFKKTFAKSD